MGKIVKVFCDRCKKEGIEARESALIQLLRDEVCSEHCDLCEECEVEALVSLSGFVGGETKSNKRNYKINKDKSGFTQTKPAGTYTTHEKKEEVRKRLCELVSEGRHTQEGLVVKLHREFSNYKKTTLVAYVNNILNRDYSHKITQWAPKFKGMYAVENEHGLVKWLRGV